MRFLMQRYLKKTVQLHCLEYSEYHVLQYNDQNLALANMTVSGGVSPSPKGGGSRLGLAPSKCAIGDTEQHLRMQTRCVFQLVMATDGL